MRELIGTSRILERKLFIRIRHRRGITRGRSGIGLSPPLRERYESGTELLYASTRQMTKSPCLFNSLDDGRNIPFTLTTGLEMTDSFSAAKLARKRRQKWWSHHIPLAYAFLISLFLVIYLGFAFVDRHITRWLTTLGISPSGVNLLLGTVSCGLGIWGIRSRQGLGTGWVVIFAWCLLSGILTLAKAFSFF